jgi:pimeloyl-ACP methyl ester carboxylesterase
MGRMYQAKRISHSEFVPIRNLQYHVRVWGRPQPDQPPLVMVHGWMDVAASYQFVVDALKQERYVIAPDWRGFGLTGSGGADNFWYPDYLADLDFLLDHYAPGQAVDLVGHSMGGNIVMLYAGVRPERVRRLINLEGFGMPATEPSQAGERLAKWMDELKSLHQGELALKAYDSVEGVARRLMKTNPRLGADKAGWLASHWARPDAQGQWSIMGEAGHKVTNAYLYRLEEVLDIHQRISAPVLSVEASDNSMALWWKGKYTLAEYHERLKSVPNVRIETIDDAGHMMHHDQPEILAALMEQFLATAL